MRTTTAATAGLGLALLLSGCGQGVTAAGEPSVAAPGAVAPRGTPSPEDRNLVPAGYEGPLRGSGLVLEAAGAGPQLCFGPVKESLPPQCGGPVVQGWDWDDVDPGSYEVAGDVRWGSYVVTGTYDGERFVMTAPPAPPDPDLRYHRMPVDFSAPCPEPAGGWESSGGDRDRQRDDVQAAAAVAEGVEGFGALWVDRRTSVTEAGPTEDPADTVLVVLTAGDQELMRQQVRSVWDGALCVAPARRTAHELQRIQQETTQLPGHLSSGSGGARGVVDVQLIVATQAQQAELDARYGTGAVELSGALEPVAPLPAD